MILAANDATLIAAPETRSARFGALYERHYQAVFAWAYRRCGDHARAEDIAAQTFVQALQAFDRYEDRGAPVAAWLFRIAANILAGAARRAQPTFAFPTTDPGVEAMDDAPGPASLVEASDLAAWTRDLLATLPANQRRALWLRFGEDRAVREVAAEIGRTPNATKQLLHRAIKTLRAYVPPTALDSD